MGFFMYCDNKGCCKQMEPLLDSTNNVVECTECGKEIKNVTTFAKTQMKSLGQVKKAQAKKAFAVQCKECKKENVPKVDSEGAVVCGSCGKQMKHLSAPYVQLLKEQLKGS